MKGEGFNKWVFTLLYIFVNFNYSNAIETQPIKNHPSNLNLFMIKINQVFQWKKPQIYSQDTHLTLEFHTFLAGFLCFVATSISTAGGIGGGGMFIAILNIVAGLDLRTASSFSAFMVTGGSVANVIYTLCIKCPKFGNKTLLDYDLALSSEPMMLLGVSVGVICNLVFPEWLSTILFTVFLAFSTYKTCKAGVLCWKAESDEMRENGFCNFENGLMRDEICDRNGGEESMEEHLLGRKRETSLGIPWKKLGNFVMVWLAFFVLHVLRGGRDGQSVLHIEPCGNGYWVLSLIQIPLAIFFTAWILHERESPQDHTSNHLEERARTPSSKLIFPIVALLSGVLGGLFGIGGGMLMSPMFLQLGLPPEVTAATCSFMVLFSSSMSAAQYLLLGMSQINEALMLTVGCFIASSLGLLVLQRAIVKYGRASLIIFSLGTVMALSTVLITSIGALDVWRDYTSGKYLGFRQPC